MKLILQCLVMYMLSLVVWTELTEDYVDEWAVHVVGGEGHAREVAKQLGFKFAGQIGSLPDYYHFRSSNGARRNRRSTQLHTQRLKRDKRITWSEQQVAKLRVKRDFVDKRRDLYEWLQYLKTDRYSPLETNKVDQSREFHEIPFHKTNTHTENISENSDKSKRQQEEKAYRSVHYDDTYWENEWYLKDTRRSLDVPKLDLHVIPVWAQNITGRGVVVTVLDDGIEYNHTDLIANYDPDASYDLNDDDSDPLPLYDEQNFNKHGTRCAGEIAMMANNQKCGVGVAYNAKIGGVRMLDGVVTDRLEAHALSHNINHIDIMSASWGPNDDGGTVEGPGTLASAAFKHGITKGRGGKGILYVWASGNGGGKGDNCDCDGYTGSIYTLSISSASQDCQSPWYAERCASTIATTYSSGTLNEQKIISTDLHDTCTTEHTGTSASAPLAAGIFALLLEANPSLTWRDVQHLVAWTSEYAPLVDNPGWHENGAGFWVNTRFGFGLLNAAAIVNAANPQVYKTVPEKSICTVQSGDDSGLPQTLNNGGSLKISISTSGCEGQDNEINHLEHVQLLLDMQHSHRGDLQIDLTSPKGVTTNLLSKRPSDTSQAGFIRWPFMSVHSWGEAPQGDWVVTITDTNEEGDNQGVIDNVSLVLHGSKLPPDHVVRAGGRRKYDYNYNSVHNERDSENMLLDQKAVLNKALENSDNMVIGETHRNLHNAVNDIGQRVEPYDMLTTSDRNWSEYEELLSPLLELEAQKQLNYDIPVERHRPELTQLRSWEKAYNDYIENNWMP